MEECIQQVYAKSGENEEMAGAELSDRAYLFSEISPELPMNLADTVPMALSACNCAEFQMVNQDSVAVHTQQLRA